MLSKLQSQLSREIKLPALRVLNSTCYAITTLSTLAFFVFNNLFPLRIYLFWVINILSHLTFYFLKLPLMHSEIPYMMCSFSVFHFNSSFHKFATFQFIDLLLCSFITTLVNDHFIYFNSINLI